MQKNLKASSRRAIAIAAAARGDSAPRPRRLDRSQPAGRGAARRPHRQPPSGLDGVEVEDTRPERDRGEQREECSGTRPVRAARRSVQIRADLERVPERPPDRQGAQPSSGRRAQRPRRRAQQRIQQAAREQTMKNLVGDKPRNVSDWDCRRRARPPPAAWTRQAAPPTKQPAGRSARSAPSPRTLGGATAPFLRQGASPWGGENRNIGATRIIGIIRATPSGRARRRAGHRQDMRDGVAAATPGACKITGAAS